MQSGSRHQHVFEVEYRNSSGDLEWRDTVYNLVPNAALDAILDNTYKTKTAASNYYVGLVTGPGSGTTYAAADTMSSHSGWSEDTTYSDSTRPECVFGSVSSQSVDNSASKAVFNINGTATIAGCFLATNSTKSGTSGTLMGCGDFTSGDKSVSSGGTLTVTVTATAAAA